MTEPTHWPGEAPSPRPPARRDGPPNWWQRNQQRVGYALLVPLSLLLVGFLWVWYAPCWLGGCAPTDDLSRFQAEGSELLDVNGETFARLATVDRRIVPLDSIPDRMVDAFLAIEDRRFYSHAGLDARRFGSAMIRNVTARDGLEGGSTISMQLARNLFPDQLPFQRRTMRRKIMEIRVARQLERQLTKDKILELYLNHIYLGSGAYGVEAAAQVYFGKSVAELDLPETATIAGLPQQPSRVNPHENAERARERRDVVLRRMADTGAISEAEKEEAQGAEMVTSDRALRTEEDAQAAYFRERVRRVLEDEIGGRFYTDGLRVHTTLDISMQRAAEEELERQIRSIEAGAHGAYRHAAYSPGSDETAADRAGGTPYLQGAAVILDAQSGAVRALVGGRDFADSKFDRAMQASRQPGSAFKPFVYLAALQRGRNPLYQVEDAPIEVSLGGTRVWRPRNFDRRFDGPMTIREALTRSKNVPTVRLSQEIGMGSVISVASRAGINSDVPDMPSTALGAAEVTPMELISAYAPFANGGDAVEPFFITRIENREGRVLWEHRNSPSRGIDAAEAFVLTTMLRDVVDRGTGAAVRQEGFALPAAGKTGTTNDATDVWFVGYTPDLVAGIWIGMDTPQTIVSGATGGRLAAPAWARMMRRAYEARSSAGEWSMPGGVATATADRATGQVVSDMCPGSGQEYTEYFIGSPPSPGPCPGAEFGDEYFDDWLGEDWGDFERDDWYGESVDWPELDERRQRGRDPLPDDTMPRDTLRDPRDPEPVDPAPPSPPQPPPPQPVDDDDDDDGPDLLGDPIEPPPLAVEPARRGNVSVAGR